jgi:hypothetical protein
MDGEAGGAMSLAAARACIDRGEVGPGRAMLDALHRAHAHEAEYLDCRLELARRAGDMAQALELGLRLSRDCPEWGIHRYALADVASHLGNVAEALPAIEAIASRLDIPVANQVRAEAWFVMGLDAEVIGLAGLPITRLGRVYIGQSMMRAQGIASGLHVYGDAWTSGAARAEIHGMAGEDKATYWFGQSALPLRLRLRKRGGIGDYLLWARYLPLLEARGTRVIHEIEFETSMRPLIAKDAVPVDTDAGKPSLPLPGAWTDPFALFAFMFPHYGYAGGGPYYRPVPSARADAIARRARQAAGGKPCWAIFWSANESHGNFALKSACLPHVRGLLESDKVHWVVLQRGYQMDLWMQEPAHVSSTNVTSPLGIDDTAALARQLDGVVCMDSALAHISACVGARTCMLASHAPCWRYEQFPRRSPWYDSQEIYRQPALGDWAGAARSLASAIGA